MIPVEKIVEAIQEQAKQGSCKTCRWCYPYKEPEEFQPGVMLTHECEIQGNVNPIWFTDANLVSKPYPWICDEGSWKATAGCMAYQPASAYPIPFDEDSRGKAIIQHREFLDDLAEAIEIYYAIRDNSLAKLTVKLNAASGSLPGMVNDLVARAEQEQVEGEPERRARLNDLQRQGLLP